MPRLRHILVANRGEIALRIMRTARALGVRTTAIYSSADAAAPHVAFADVAVEVGPAEVALSYLNSTAIIEAAKRTGADAVHPGYGLLAENAAFAGACGDAGLVFIGPRPETIALMGDKRRARIAMQAAGVACVPGYDGDDQSDAVLVREASRIGYPVMVKAALGGGGRGMRRVEDGNGLVEAIARARSEAQKSFGDGRLILERALDAARHIEVQVVADSHGHVIHLGERDCSLQRRFQKVIEEAPSPAVDAALRQRIGEVAVQCARSASYVGAGTVELLLTPEGHFYFLEMNTRLQVEHAVTEMLTGIDLVQWQLRIAQGEPLPLSQRDVRFGGHAIEARLCAENPERGFLPETGKVMRLALPEGEGVRIDHGLSEGLAVGSHYDSMLGKLIAHGEDREQARRRLIAALKALRVLGVGTNQGFLCKVLEHPSFVAGQATTDFVDRELSLELAPTAPDRDTWIGAAVALLGRARRKGPYPEELAAYTNAVELAWPFVLACEETRFTLAIEPARGPGELSIRIGDDRVQVMLVESTQDVTTAIIDGVRRSFDHAFEGDRLFLHTPDGARGFDDVTYAAPVTAEAAGSGRASAPMDGTVVELCARPGEQVKRGQTLLVIAAMKLELRVAADTDGVIAAVHAKLGEQVKARQVLVEVCP